MFYYPLLLFIFLIGPGLAIIPGRFSITLWQHWSLIAICLVYGISPLILAFGGFYLAKVFQCEVTTITYTCPQQPWLGNIITWMTFAHWLAFLTIPAAVLGMIGLLIALVKVRN